MTENKCKVINTLNTCSTRQAHNEEWVSQVTNELNNLTETSSMESVRWRKQSVYRVPSSVKDLCETAYEPQTVSIGPYHHDKPHLKGMEEHKHRALLHFLNRSGKPLRCYLNALAQVVEDLKHAYDQLDEKWQQDTDEAFLELMIVDGCFILELLRTNTTTTTTTADDDDQSSGSSKTTTHMKMGYADNDPVFSNHGKLYIVPELKRDMLMLENQLPILVLTTLIAAESDMQTEDESSKEEEVTRLIVNFFLNKKETNKNTRAGKCLHILDVYRKSLLSDPPVDDRNKTKQGRHRDTKQKHNHERRERIILSATDLRETGVQIKQSKTDSLNDIKFHRGTGVLELPRIVVDETLESQYLNLMAFERFHVEAGCEITSYVLFMDNLIDSPRDVSLLHKHGIVRNEIGSQKAIANLFNSTWTISRGISLGSKSSLDHVSMKISDNCQQPCPKWRATLKHRYFTNPWAGLSVFAAVFLFPLAGFQTVYTILSYYDPNK